MTTLASRLGSMGAAEEPDYDNESDPWDNEMPLSFQSTRRESRAKPPPTLRVPRALTLPSLLSIRSHIRNRSGNDAEQIPFSPTMMRGPKLSPKSPASPTRQRVADDHHPIEEVSPASAPLPYKSKTKLSKSFVWNKKGGKQRNRSANDLDEMIPVSPVSEDVGLAEDESSRHNWFRGRVRRVFRLGRRERG